MSTLGNKRSSKAYLSEHAPEVPLIPGFSGTSQQLQDLEDAARLIGFPVMLKASAGGGGKGMRIVRDPSTLRNELERAQSEAKRNFGSDDRILEKYIEAGKHVEIQIVGDQHGRVVSLWDRDCSVQRRHQKVIEEAPCSWLSDDMRKRMSDTAVHIAELIAYEGAGTVEFVVDVVAEKYYFLEVNARLQVEHPITEEVTGVDLVALQLYVATGGRLDDLEVLKTVQQHGHAIECRLCAEDAHRDFYPEHGTVRLWQPAPGILGPGRDIRYETAVRNGSEVSIYFDSMIAKIIVWAPNRTQAIAKMLKVLANTACVGVRTNQLFLQSCLANPGFRDPVYTTSYIANNLERLLKNPYCADSNSVYKSVGATACLYLRSQQHNLRSAFRNVRMGFRNQPFDPINRHVSFVVNTPEGVTNEEAQARISLVIAETVANKSQHFNIYLSEVPQPKENNDGKMSVAKAVTAQYNAVSATIRSGKWKQQSLQRFLLENIVRLDQGSEWRSDVVTSSISGRKLTTVLCTPSPYTTTSSSHSDTITLYAHIPALGTWTSYKISSPLAFAESLRSTAAASTTEDALKVVRAPMPCKVLKVLKKKGEDVNKGEVVMVIESMKMEMSISAPSEGVFETERGEGNAVSEGAVLCEIS
jgi:acetyl/propionyl-CoA carboxylase alpha subunit